MGTGKVDSQVTEADALWKTCSEALRGQVSEGTWLTWFDQIKPARSDGDRLVLAVPSTVVKERVESRYLSLVRDVVSDAAGHPILLEFEVQTLSGGTEASDGAGRGLLDGGVWSEPMPEPVPAAAPVTATVAAAPTFEDVPLDPRYVFDAFVIGASNRFAHAAALSVAETPAKSYNPLFIYGDAGLGKTHLLHAIGNYIRENFPSRYVKYVSTEMFMNEYVDMIRTNSGPAFRRRYRECDVLLIDDVQFMENKEGLQEEFFHTFNSLYGASKQIVITSDRPPKSIATLEDRLRTRFLSGLITDVQPPELETRLAILRKKAEGERVHVPDDVLEFIASNVKDNIRELEGALIRVSAFASLQRQPLTLELAVKVLADLVRTDHPRQITPQSILEATARMFGFSIEEICGHNRRRPLVTARQVSMYVFREVTDFSYPAIAREFGGRDHTTVIHAVEKVAGLMKERRDIFDKVDELIKTVRSSG